MTVVFPCVGRGSHFARHGQRACGKLVRQAGVDEHALEHAAGLCRRMERHRDGGRVAGCQPCLADARPGAAACGGEPAHVDGRGAGVAAGEGQFHGRGVLGDDAQRAFRRFGAEMVAGFRCHGGVQHGFKAFFRGDGLCGCGGGSL